MALFSSDNPKEKQHKGILGAFAVDVIKWEPETDEEARIIVQKSKNNSKEFTDRMIRFLEVLS